MKIPAYLLALVLFFVSLPAVHAQEYGRIRALQETTDKRQQITAQALLFSTSGGVLDLVAEMIIR